MASTTEAATVFTHALLPDSRCLPNNPNAYIQRRSVSQFFDLVSQLPPKGATVVCLEYWGWNKGPKRLHHFLCATIQLQDTRQLQVIIERRPIATANSSKIAASKLTEAADEFTIFDRARTTHPNLAETKGSDIRCFRAWDAANRPTLFGLAAVAKAVSIFAPYYHLIKTQCIWYALTVFHLAPPVAQYGSYPVVFTALENAVKIAISTDATQYTVMQVYAMMLKENHGQLPYTAGPSSYQGGHGTNNPSSFRS